MKEAFNKNRNQSGRALKHEPDRTSRMPVVFTSHGNPMDIPLAPYSNPFLNYLGDLGTEIRQKYKVNAMMVISAHWCTKGTFVNISPRPETIYDYYGFPANYYTKKYPAPGAPEIAQSIADKLPKVEATNEWGLDHGCWPMLMHLFPNADVPVFQMSIDYNRPAQYHFNLAKQLRQYRDQGLLIIGSGAIIHNLPLAINRMQAANASLFGWEEAFDNWIKEKIDTRDFQSLINYQKHELGLKAAPTPDHFVPLLYALALADDKDDIRHTFTGLLPAFSNRSLMIEPSA